MIARTRTLLTLSLLIASSFALSAQTTTYTRYANYCGGPGTNPILSSPQIFLQSSYPNCTVKIYSPGTTSLATIYADANGTIKANPFTADRTGYFYFYEITGQTVDINLSGSTIPSPITWPSITIGGGSGGGGGSGCTDAPLQQIPSGTPNGTLTTFTLTQVPASNTLLLTNNGVTQYQGVAYTITGNVITFNAGYIPQSNDLLYASYFYQAASPNCLGVPAENYLDVRNFGAVGITGTTPGSCKGSTIDNIPAFNSAIAAGVAMGVPRIYVPGGYCYPIGSHLYLPQGLEFFGVGRTFGNQQSSQGSLIIANANFAPNQTFPYSQMIWISGDNYTSPQTVVAVNTTFGTVLRDLQLDAGDIPGVGNIYAIGQQEKSHLYRLLLTGVTTPTTSVNGGYVYSVYKQGVDCNGQTPPAKGCLIPSAGLPGINPNNGQDGPDSDLEIFPSYSVEPATGKWIPFAAMGMNDYQGLQHSTVNGYYGSNTPYGVYYWGSNSVMGPYHVERVLTAGTYIGPVPNFTAGTCNGADHSTFIGLDTTVEISQCSAQQQLAFIGQGTGGNLGTPSNYSIINDFGSQYNSIDSSYCWDISITDGSYSYGPCGIRAGFTTQGNIVIADPGEFQHTGYLGLDFYNGTAHSGYNAGQAIETATNSMRGYSCGSIYWNHITGIWTTGNNGGQDWECGLLLNAGWFGVSAAYNSNYTTTVANSTLLSYIGFLAGGTNHNVLLGPGWINTSTGVVSDITGNHVGWKGGAIGDSLSITGTSGASGFVPYIIYSAVSTPVPTCNSASRGLAVTVGDAATPTYLGTYVSGGGITVGAICSYNGTTYSWLTH